MKQQQFRPAFVEFIPPQLEDGVLYVSITYKTAAHSCACGCGHKVATPITPTDWRFEYDGEVVTLWPSIGNWQFPCRSHYWIKSNNVYWSSCWSDDEIISGRGYDAKAKERYFAQDTITRPQDLRKIGEDDSHGKRLEGFRRYLRKVKWK